jgi:hypothetical protein
MRNVRRDPITEETYFTERTELVLTLEGIAYDDPENLIEPEVDRIKAAVSAAIKGTEKDNFAGEVLGFAYAAREEGFDVKFDPFLAMVLKMEGAVDLQ